MELDIMERVKLLEVLPPQGDLITLKILRKLRETLSFSEAELKLFDTSYEYMCPHRSEETGRLVKCENKGFFVAQPTCGMHDELMLPTGEMNLQIPPAALAKTKEIHLGTQALGIAASALKQLNNSGQLTEAHVSLYEKFFPPDDKDTED